MPPITPPLEFDHLPGQEIETKHKEAIRQLYGFAKVPVKVFITRYGRVRSTIKNVLQYNAPERARITRTRRPSLLTNQQVNEIIKYASETWQYQILNYTLLYDELGLECSAKPLEKRLK
jgi:hypothetical protein